MSKPHASTATIERLIVGKVIDELVGASIGLRVETGNKTTLLSASDDADTVMAAIFSSYDGEAWVFARTSKGKYQPTYVKFVLGNGVDVLSDYHIALEPFMAKARALADALEA